MFENSRKSFEKKGSLWLKNCQQNAQWRTQTMKHHNTRKQSRKVKYEKRQFLKQKIKMQKKNKEKWNHQTTTYHCNQRN